MGTVAQFSKSNGGVDEIAKNDLAGFHVPGKKVFDALSEKRLAKTRITFHARPDCFLEISCQSHSSHPPASVRCLWPSHRAIPFVCSSSRPSLVPPPTRIPLP